MSHALYGVDKERWPVLVMDTKDGTFTNVGGKGRRVVHLDLGMSVYLETEEQFVNACEVFIGHEVQHIRSTAAKAWLYGLNNGKLAICQEHMKQSGGKPRILNNARQADAYIKELQDAGYMVSKNSLEYLVHFVMNSVEDGRIERILCVQKPGFKAKLAAFRGMEWMVNDACGEHMPGFDDPRGFILNILNQVLNLSTMSIYQKGFVVKSTDDNRAYLRVKELIPLIAKGVSAESCREGMDAAIAICRELAMDILEASKMTPLEQLINQLLKQFSEDASYSADSTNEEKDGTPGEALFGRSDLVIEVDDDVFDRMEEEQKKSGNKNKGNGMSIILKRKHPKTPKEDGSDGEGQDGQGTPSGNGGSQEGKGTGSGSGDGKSGRSGKKETGNAEEKGSSTGKENKPDGKSLEQGENSSGPGRQDQESGDSQKDGSPEKTDSQNGQEEDPGSKEESQDAPSSKDSPSMDKKTSGEKENGPSKKDVQDKDGQRQEDSSHGREDEQAAAAMVEQAVRNKIQECAPGLEHAASRASHEAYRDAKDANKPPVIQSIEDRDPDSSIVDAMYDSLPKGFRFRELKRSYVPCKQMPMDLKNKAELLKRNLIQILKNQCEPDMRERKSGILDPAFLYRLAMGNMDCFIQKGMESEFNGCAYILMDRSGSMGGGYGSKFYDCCHAMALIEHAFTDILPLKIASFHAEYYDNVTHEVIKNWHEKLPYNGSYNFLENRRSNGGNKDGYSIRIATTELLSQPYEKKILIVLSDGLPSAYEKGMRAGLSDVKSAVQYARKQGVDVVSIFFGDKEDETQFCDIYGGKNCIVTSPDRIGDELYKVMKHSVVNMI